MGGLLRPKIQAAPAPLPTPTVNQEIVDRQLQDVMRRRRGSAAGVTGAASIGTTAGSVASKDLLGG